MHIIDLQDGENLADVQKANPDAVIRDRTVSGSVVMYWPGKKAPQVIPANRPTPTVIR